jgi:hypothetical protein
LISTKKLDQVSELYNRMTPANDQPPRPTIALSSPQQLTPHTPNPVMRHTAHILRKNYAHSKRMC